MIFICYKKCSTCKKVEKMMRDKNLSYETRQIDEENPSKAELQKWYEQSGLDIKKFFNTSGKIYREKNLKDKLEEMSLDQKLELLASDGMLVKRPIILDKDKVFVGPDAKKYVESL